MSPDTGITGNGYTVKLVDPAEEFNRQGFVTCTSTMTAEDIARAREANERMKKLNRRRMWGRLLGFKYGYDTRTEPLWLWEKEH
jgi:hypothetical protein